MVELPTVVVVECKRTVSCALDVVAAYSMARIALRIDCLVWGQRIDGSGELLVERIYVGASGYGFSIFHNGCRQPVAHDRGDVGIGCLDERRVVERSEYLCGDRVLIPPVGC